MYYAGTPDRLESRLVPAAGLPYKAFEVAGFARSHPLSLFKSLKKISRSTRLARAWFDEIKPDAVIGFGGYVCIPVARAAEQVGIPVVLHEQNSVMGLANRYLSKRAARVCLTYADTIGNETPVNRICVTGNPVRRAVLTATRQEGLDLYGMPADACVLLVFGGSLGAQHLNHALITLKDELLSRPNVQVIHITGTRDFDATEEALALTDAQRKRWHLLGYQDEMPATLAAADCIVSRAGATSLAEISARCIPALLVPYPQATEDHQTKNATEYVASGAAIMIPDADLDTPEFPLAVLDLVDDADLRRRMSAAAHSLDTANAAEKLADAVFSVLH